MPQTIGHTPYGFIPLPGQMPLRFQSWPGKEIVVPQTASIVPLERIADRIVLVRGEKVLLDADLAQLYGVPTKELNQAVRRNIERFPADFMFRLTDVETESLRSQIVTSNVGRGGRRTPPYAFTEQGIAMLSGVLRSDRAVAVNVAIMRAFVQMRRLLSTHGELAKRIDELQAQYDGQFAMIFDALRSLVEESQEQKKNRSPIGFIGELTRTRKPRRGKR